MLIIRALGLCEYTDILKKMQYFTKMRDPHTPDELWCLEHTPVFTQGQAGRKEHVLDPGDIPMIQSDRGGQITYHGPGQLICYFLIHLKRKKIGIRSFVEKIEQAVVQFLKKHQIDAQTRAHAPGVYVGAQKICSLGLRVRKGCTYHGLSLNVNMDLAPFKQIHPCGFSDLTMVQTKDLQGPASVEAAKPDLLENLLTVLPYEKVTYAY